MTSALTRLRVRGKGQATGLTQGAAGVMALVGACPATVHGSAGPSGVPGVEKTTMGVLARGALGGWKRSPSEHGIRLTLQVAPSVEEFHERRFGHVEIALNDRQLRSLTRDLMRASRERDLTLFARRPWWRKLLRH